MSTSGQFNEGTLNKKPLTVAVFSGSRTGIDPADKEDAIYVGKALGMNGICLAYGGGNSGNMGFSSAACLEAGGLVRGFNLSCFAEAYYYPQKSYEVVCRSIAIRKEEMLALADAYIALGGGLGSLDEIVDAANEQCLAGYMTPPVAKKPIILINRGGLYDDLPKLFEAQIRRGYTSKNVPGLITYVSDGQGAIRELAKHFGMNMRLLPEFTVQRRAPR